MSVKKTTFALLSFALATVLSGCDFSLAAEITPPPITQPASPVVQTQTVTVEDFYPLIAPDPANGESIFTEKCAPCHGDQGRGDGVQSAQLPNPVPAIGNPEIARQATPSKWFSIVTNGNLERYMPPFASLDDSERWDVVAYLYQLSTTEVELDMGQQLFEVSCASCHGQNGEKVVTTGDGRQVGFSGSVGQRYMANVTANDLYLAIQNGAVPAMPAFGNELSSDQIWAVSSYLRVISFGLADTETASAPTAPSGNDAEEPTPEDTQTAALEPGDYGSVSGVVSNGSGGILPEDLAVTLHALDEMQVVFTLTTTLQTDGSFTFDEVEFANNRVFVATTDYQGATYGSDIATVQPGQSSLELPLTIFETSPDSSALVVDRLHIFLDFPTEEVMQVVELYVISNPTNKTIVAAEEGGGVVEFSVPASATNLQFQDGAIGERYQVSQSGFMDTIPVRPGSGQYQVMYAYDLPYDKKADFEQTFPLNMDAVILMAPNDGIKIKSDDLESAGVRDVQGTEFAMYTTSSLAAGQRLKISVSGSPAGAALISQISPTSSTGLVIGLAALGGVLIVAGIWLYSRNRAESVPEDLEDEEMTDDGGDDLSHYTDTETVMDAIIALDELYGEGELSEDAYQERRAQLKRRLAQLME